MQFAKKVGFFLISRGGIDSAIQTARSHGALWAFCEENGIKSRRFLGFCRPLQKRSAQGFFGNLEWLSSCC